VAERPGVGLDARHLVAIRVAVQRRERFGESREFFRRNETAHREYRVQRRGTVALAQDEAITFGPLRVGRVVVHDAAEQRDQRIRGREVAADVAQPGTFDDIEHTHAKLAGELAQLRLALSRRGVADGRHPSAAGFQRREIGIHTLLLLTINFGFVYLFRTEYICFLIN
jgi:hypothetical protein